MATNYIGATRPVGLVCMIITCPNCETRFNVDRAALVPSGRSVRCGRCSRQWTQRPPDGVDPPAFADDDDIPDLVERSVVPQPGPIGRRGRAATIGGWLALVLIVAAVIGGGILARETIVETWPPAAQLFELAGMPVDVVGFGLEFRDITSRQEAAADGVALVVDGEVVNSSDRALPIPRLRGSLLDVREREIFVWIFTAESEMLAPGEATPFSTRLPNPPTNARGIAVTFAVSE